MKKPVSPPNLESIRKQIETKPGQLGKLFDLNAGPLVKNKYLHWDKLRFYTPPEGFTNEQWWLAIKKQRQSLYSKLPLKDENQNSFKYLTIDYITQTLLKIDQSLLNFNQMSEQISKTETKNRYYVRSLIQEAFTSSQLEGATTTRLVAKEMIQTGRQPTDKSEQMILNNFSAMKHIHKLKDEPLTKELIFELHQLVTEKTLEDPSAVGRFRNADERIVISDMYNEIFHEPPPADQLENRMELMCDFANEKNMQGFIHPIVRAITLHFWLAYDHPFVDGNGRTARALFYWLMMRHRYWIFEFVSISQIIVKAPAKYGRAFLYTETDDNDLTYFIIYHLKIIERAIEELYKYIELKTKRVETIKSQLQGIVVLNHRQRAIISHALKHPNHRYTIKSHRISHNVVYQTSRTDLLDLESRGLLTCEKIGKTWYFKPAANLEEKLTNLP